MATKKTDPLARLSALISNAQGRRLVAVGIAAVVVVIIAAVLALGGKSLIPTKGQGPAASAPPAGAETPAPKEVPPTFDIVRVDRRGTAVIAGRAAPKARIAVRIADRVIGEAVANDKGEWVVTVEQALPPGSQELYIEATGSDGVVKRSAQSVVVVVPERDAPGNDPPLVVLSQPGQASRVLQGPAGEVGAGDLTLDSVDYDSKGGLILSGKAKVGAVVRPYLDNKPLGEAKADASGRWRLEPKAPIAPGTYGLRVDELGADGKVAQRLEVPFERASASSLASGNIIVQPGNSLWRIARRTLGGGEQYVTIYRANKDAIKDPNLIYPGQVLTLPER